VTRFAVGDEVYARPRDGRIGTFAERIAVPEGDLAIKPASLSMAEAASVPLVALTAWQALVERANLQPGQKVLIHAGSGGVGTYAIQLAKHLGATVATTTGSSNVDWVGELGADVVVDYRSQDFETVLHGYDVVLDSQGGDTLAKSLRVLKPGGIALGLAGPPDSDFARRQGLHLPLRLVMALLSLKTRRAARRRGARTRSYSCAPAVPTSARSPSSSTRESSVPSSTARTRSKMPRRPSLTSRAAGARARSSSPWSRPPVGSSNIRDHAFTQTGAAACGTAHSL
jgi:NADPH:quinone reductase-like Zn-dependent oxidoreductase